MPWRTRWNENDKPVVQFELETVIFGFFRPDLFLDYVRYFILFEQDGDGLIKKIFLSAMRSTCGMRCRVRRSSASPARRSRRREHVACFQRAVIRTEKISRMPKLDINREEIDRLNKDVEEVIAVGSGDLIVPIFVFASAEETTVRSLLLTCRRRFTTRWRIGRRCCSRWAMRR